MSDVTTPSSTLYAAPKSQSIIVGSPRYVCVESPTTSPTKLVKLVALLVYRFCALELVTRVMLIASADAITVMSQVAVNDPFWSFRFIVTVSVYVAVLPFVNENEGRTVSTLIDFHRPGFTLITPFQVDASGL